MVKALINKAISKQKPANQYYIKSAIRQLKGVPRVNKSNQKKMGKGIVTISADFELAWAFMYSKSGVNPEDQAKKARKNIPVLLGYFDKYKIPITWATVGHLFLDSCEKKSHTWMRKMHHFDNHWLFNKGDWFQHDPNSNLKQNNSWYAPDIIESILNSKAHHEIGCHTFSHINCRNEICPPDVLRDELMAWKDAASVFGITAESFVFPGGTYGNFKVLKEFGYKIYRTKSTNFELSSPVFDNNGLIQTFSSSAFQDPLYGYNPDLYINSLKKSIEKAIKNKTFAHIWFHPSVDPWIVQNVFPEILKFISTNREKDLLEVKTMRNLINLI